MAQLTLKTRSCALLVMIILLMAGCSSSQGLFSKQARTPERVYLRPLRNYYQNSAVLVFEFKSPYYAPGSGYAAANILYQTLLKSNTFRKVDFIPKAGTLNMEDQLNVAREKGADLIITGRVKYYFDGKIYLRSRVDQEIRIISSASNKTHWYAEASSSGKTRPEQDFILVKRKEKKGPAPKELMAENAAKFLVMIRRESPEIKMMSEEALLLDTGYNYLLDKKYNQAGLYYEKALRINPNNAVAHFNMGVIYEHRGETLLAMKAYQKVISLNPGIIIQESDNPEKTGTSLSDWARENLDRLDKKGR